MYYTTTSLEHNLENLQRFVDDSVYCLKYADLKLLVYLREVFCLSTLSFREGFLGWNNKLQWHNKKALPQGLVVPIYDFNSDSSLNYSKLLGFYILCLPIHTYINKRCQVRYIEQITIMFENKNALLILPACSINKEISNELVIVHTLKDAIFLWQASQYMYSVALCNNVTQELIDFSNKFNKVVIVYDINDKTQVEKFTKLRLKVPFLRDYPIKLKSIFNFYESQYKELDSLGKNILLEKLLSSIDTELTFSATKKLIYAQLAKVPLNLRQQRLQKMLSYFDHTLAESLDIQI